MSARNARVCPSKDCNWREFNHPRATCPAHGRGIDQPDIPYFVGPESLKFLRAEAKAKLEEER